MTTGPRHRTQPKPEAASEAAPEAAPEPVVVEIKTPEPSEPALSPQTLAEQAAGRAALVDRAK